MILIQKLITINQTICIPCSNVLYPFLDLSHELQSTPQLVLKKDLHEQNPEPKNPISESNVIQKNVLNIFIEEIV